MDNVETETQIQKALRKYLETKWKKREKLLMKADKLREKANRRYANAVRRVYGSKKEVIIDWETGKVWEWAPPEEE